MELKLDIQEADIERFLTLAWLHSSQNLEQQPDRYLENTYYDSPSFALLENKAALRTRKAGERYYQTLKTKGSSVGGLHQRGEWEYPISAPEGNKPATLKPDLFPADAWPSGVEVADVVPIFTTNFARKTWIWTSVRASKVEIVLDKGHVSARKGQAAICEIELELLSGNPECLFDLAEAINLNIPLLISDVTKAQRGFDLLSPGRWTVFRESLESQGALNQLTAIIQHLMDSELLPDALPDVALSLVNEGVLPAMDVLPWLLLTQSGKIDFSLRTQWLLRLARHAWLLGNKDK